MNQLFKNAAPLLTLLVLLNGCRKDDPTPVPPDPCLERVPVTADFVIEQVFRDYDYEKGELMFSYDTIDTIIPGGARFSAPERPGYSYEWRIGAGVYHQRQVSLSFGVETIGQSIPITLLVEGPVDTACFPLDDGRDTLTRHLQVVDYCETRVSGFYTGHWVGTPPSDTFTIGIEMKLEPDLQYPGDSICRDLVTQNLTRRGIVCNKGSAFAGYRMIVFNTSDSDCNSPKGRGWVRGDSIRLRYLFSIFNGQTTERYPMRDFVGRRR